MKEILKRSLSVFLAVTLLLGSAYVGLSAVDFSGVFAVEAEAANVAALEFVLNSDKKSYFVSDCDANAKGSLTIPSTYGGKPVTGIGYRAFAYRENLESITIPDSVTTIDSEAFYCCRGLTNVKIPNSITSIKDATFGHCSSLKSIVVPNGVTSIDFGAFTYCESLKSITIPAGVTSIGDQAFHNCTSLKSITVDSANKKYCSVDGVLFNKGKTKLIQYPTGKTNSTYIIPSGVKSIENYAFYNCTTLISVSIPDTVTSINDDAFYGCAGLKSVAIPNSVTSIGYSAFFECTSLKSITLPNNSETIVGSNVFACCTNLKDVVIPDKVTTIGRGMFAKCDNLTSVAIPDSVTNIEHAAFGDCTSLKYVFYGGTQKQWSKVVIDGYNVVLMNANIHYNATGHNNKFTITKATLTKNGKLVPKCSVCGYVSESSVIYSPKTIKLSTTSCTYNGKVRNPSVIVKDSKGETLVKGTDYKVTVPSGRKLPGVYKYTITFIGKYSGTKTLTLKILPATVSSKMTAAPTSSSIKLTWPKVAGATGYKVYQYSPSQGKYVQIATVTGNTYKKTGLKAGTTYYFKVKAYKKLSDGTIIEGAISNAYTTATKCAAPKIANITASAGQKATLKWSAVTGATGYQVYYSTKKDSGYQKAVSTTSKSASKAFSKSANGKKIYFKVRAYKKVNGQTIYGNWSAVKSVKLK